MKKKKSGKALVVFSGGQDSTTCLGWALNRYEEVVAITFSYGQKHCVEMECAENICRMLKVRQKIVNIDFFGKLVNSALTSNGNVNERHKDNSELPASFVPNRNALFLTLAHAYAQKINVFDIIMGVCETDYSGYPDCRVDFIIRMQNALNAGSQSRILLSTPLMFLNKAQIFELSHAEGVLEMVIADSHTCYNGARETKDFHLWGFGCGDCPACKLRKKGWEGYRIFSSRK